MKKVIKDANDFLAHIKESADTLEEANHRISWRIYKSTPCGAWCKLVTDPPAGARRHEQWQVRAIRAIGSVVFGVRKNGRGKWNYDLGTVPKEVREYLNPRKTGAGRWVSRDFKKLDEIAAAAQEAPECQEEGYREKGRVFLFTFGVKTLKPSRRRKVPPLGAYGVLAGSIVEGSEAEVHRDPLMFPFTVKDWDDLIGGINDEACELWRRDNG